MVGASVAGTVVVGMAVELLGTTLREMVEAGYGESHRMASVEGCVHGAVSTLNLWSGRVRVPCC